MSDGQYFIRRWDGETPKALVSYSDKVNRLSDLYPPEYSRSAPFNMDEYLLEYEFSPQYIVGTGSFGGLVSRTVYRGDFQFTGNELTSGSISEVIRVGASGNVDGYRLANRLSVIPTGYGFDLPSPSNVRAEYGPSTPITTTDGFAQFFPAGWGNRPFEDNLVSVASTSGGSGTSSGSSGTSSPQTLTTTTSVDTLTGIKKKKDIFKFDADPSGQVDKVTGFNAKEKDVLSISKSAFGVDSGTFAVANNAKTLAKQLATSVDIVYYRKNGELILNANGPEPGFGDDGGVFAVLMGKPIVGSASVQFY
jgi:hypothetical protein